MIIISITALITNKIFGTNLTLLQSLFWCRYKKNMKKYSEYKQHRLLYVLTYLSIHTYLLMTCTNKEGVSIRYIPFSFPEVMVLIFNRVFASSSLSKQQ